MNEMRLLVELDLAPGAQGEPPDTGHGGHDADSGGRLGDLVCAVGHEADVTRAATEPGTMPIRGRSHALLPIFFTFSYPTLQIPLPTTDSMGDMPGSTFHTSQASRAMARARRMQRPALCLIQGTDGRSHPSSSDAPPAHPAQEGFIPDGIPSNARIATVHNSEPVSLHSDTKSTGKAALDAGGEAATGSGPITGRG